jgi:hypothetical protein
VENKHFYQMQLKGNTNFSSLEPVLIVGGDLMAVG